MAPKAKVHKVLIAEPELEALETLAKNLSAAGYIVVTASDGHQALDQAKAEQPDLVCIELNLPGIDGLAVCRALKAERSVPVLLAVSHLDDRTSAGFIEVGAEALLFKPYEIDEVIDKVAWYLNPQV
jgi:DNA-binding response OmpR family regulator